MTETLNETEKFFFDNAGFSFDPATETEVQGRERTARRLAAAEERMKSGPYFIGVEPDDMPWDGDVPYDGPLWVVTLFQVAGTDVPEVIGSTSGVACEAGDPYLRVVSAELASEHVPL